MKVLFLSFLSGGSSGPLMILYSICAFLLLLTAVITVAKVFLRSKTRSGVLVLLYLSTAAVLAMTLTGRSVSLAPAVQAPPVETMPQQLSQKETLPTPEVLPSEPAETTAPVETEAPPPPTEAFKPGMTQLSDPANWDVTWEIIENGAVVENYQRAEEISFGEGEDYFALPGIATFRGNNYRNSSTYGTTQVNNASLSMVWSHSIGRLDGWSGCAWTGQPLVAQWDEQTRNNMNIFSSKKKKDNLVEVIYATLDGQIHFYDLDDGQPTRNAIHMNMNFKGSGSLDPRGYPLLYVGSGLYTFGKSPRMFVVSLITGEILYEYGHNDSFAKRDWTAFDSCPLVDAETDTLIWPGENGILYTIKLNTQYDPDAGTISVSPDTPVKTRYSSAYSKDGRYLGYESSVSIVDDYLYVSENGGMFYCVDLNTMELVWAQDVGDDSNASPAFEWGEDGRGYVYTASSLHWTAKNKKGSVTMYKLDAQTGEIVWEHTHDCVTETNISGGIQATPLLGKEGTTIENMLFYTVARTPNAYDGTMYAVNRETGELIYEVDTVNYAWSSPVAMYTEEGEAYIAFANASGKIRLINGATGEVLYALGLGNSVEASPIVYKNMMVIGTREAVYGIKIS